MIAQPIGIIGAMEEEVALLRSQMQNVHTELHAGFEYTLGELHEQPVALLKSGIGKVNAAIGATLLCQLYQPKAVINTGSAGGFDPELAVGDIVISSAVCHHDVDVTPFGYEWGQVPGQPACFLPDASLVETAKAALETLPQLKAKTGLIATGDRFMHDPQDVETVRQRFPEMIAAEMEAAAIAQVCHAFQTPFVVIRALSDIAGKENALTFEQFLETAATHSATLIMEMVKKLSNYSDHP